MDLASQAVTRRRICRLVVASLLSLGLCIAWGVLCLVMNTRGGLISPLPAGSVGSQSLRQAVWQIVPEILTAFWLLITGACLGSFLNVVVYRLPRGLSLLGTSHCPHCRSSIRPRDNIPVWSWIRRRGRCRRCWLPIAARYPRVELFVAVLFLVMACLAVGAWGINLRPPRLRESWGFTLTLFEGHAPLLWRFALHTWLLLYLLAIYLMLDDSRTPPGRFALFGIVIAIATLVVEPRASAAHWGASIAFLRIPDIPTWKELIVLAGSVVAGGVLGFVGCSLAAVEDAGVRRALVLACALTGTVMGLIPGSLTIAAAFGLAIATRSDPQRKRLDSRIAFWLFTASVAMLLFWRGFASLVPILSGTP